MRLFCSVFAAAIMCAGSAAAARTIDFPDVRRIVSLSDPQLSPDGLRVVYVRAVADYSKDKRNSQIVLINVRTKQRRPLTFERTGVSSPRWSPDGRRIAFLAPVKDEKSGDEQDQIFVLRLDGGEAKQITQAPQGVDNFSWSPDGSRFSYVTQNEDPAKKQIDAHLDAFEVADNDYLHTSAAIPGHLWIVASDGGKARRLTDGPWSLETVDPTVTSDVTWSADGRSIAFIHFPTPLIGDSLGSVIETVDVRSGRASRLTGNDSLEGNPAFAPAGPEIAYTRNTSGDPTAGVSLYVTRIGAGPGVNVRRRIDREIDGMAWAQDGRSLWLFGPDREQTAAWFVSSDGTRVTRADLHGVGLLNTGNTAKNGALVFIGETPQRPPEVYVLRSASSVPAALTNENSAVVKGIELGRPVAVRWRNGRFTEDGVLTLPPRFNRARAYPLVLIVHGGPQGASTIGWNSQAQLFAAHGYLVFSPNYRGSTNLGDAYERAITRDAGEGPGRDVMAGIVQVERTYKIDRSRVAVSGWSYGGYMTS
ncbi:MAG TPA: prolyl oligopeptidase family serine peptidase, partial [Candidatus Baltobacteraceae bacterium]|nr:prolyl oligopeptidase family serine peptidase [Candidatus Baltobacteraceae bacterium]